MTVLLYTKDGSFVHEQTIPPFQEPPDVIQWGSRFFVCPSTDGEVARQHLPDDDAMVVYEEAFAYVLDPAQASSWETP